MLLTFTGALKLKFTLARTFIGALKLKFTLDKMSCRHTLNTNGQKSHVSFKNMFLSKTNF